MVNDVIRGQVTSKILKKLCKKNIFSSKNKYVKTKHSFGPNGRKNHKIYRRTWEIPSNEAEASRNT